MFSEKCPKCGHNERNYYEMGKSVAVMCAHCAAHIGWCPDSLDRNEALSVRMPFGKYRGQPFLRIPQHYIDWAHNTLDKLPLDVQMALQTLARR